MPHPPTRNAPARMTPFQTGFGRRASPAACLLAAAALTACGTPPERPIDPLEGTEVQGPQVVPVTIDGPQGVEQMEPSAAQAPVERVIYFDYDQAELRPEFLDIVASHGRWLAQNPQARVRLEGHTDERGSREYNIALGERRAKTVSRMLQLQGVASAQLRTVSYGEELPVDEGHDPEAWSKNRRVNIIYEGGTIQN